jgi:hypothetical protein
MESKTGVGRGLLCNLVLSVLNIQFCSETVGWLGSAGYNNTNYENADLSSNDSVDTPVTGPWDGNEISVSIKRNLLPDPTTVNF